MPAVVAVASHGCVSGHLLWDAQVDRTAAVRVAAIINKLGAEYWSVPDCASKQCQHWPVQWIVGGCASACYAAMRMQMTRIVTHKHAFHNALRD